MKANKIDTKSYGVQCRCNAVVKSLSILMLQRLGYSVSTAYSRFVSGKGLVSLYDRETLMIILDLKKLVSHFCYHFTVPDTLAKWMRKYRDDWRIRLDSLADYVETGAEPVYCQTLAAGRGGDVVVEYDLLKRYILWHVVNGTNSLTAYQRIYATSPLSEEEQAMLTQHLTGASKADRDKYIKARLSLSKEQIDELLSALDEDTIKTLTKMFAARMFDIRNEKDPKVKLDKQKAFETMYFVPYLDRWSFRASFENRVSRSNYIRDRIEFIYSIPNRTDDALRSMLHNDISILMDFMEQRQILTDEYKKLPQYSIQKQAAELCDDVVGKLVWPEMRDQTAVLCDDETSD